MKKKQWRVPFVYLPQQYAQPHVFFKHTLSVIAAGDFTLGKKLTEFEHHFATAIGVSHAIGVASGTDALYLVLKALEICPGDEVITAPNSFVATAAVIALCGARPVFVDVGDDYQLDPSLLESAITKKTKAIIPVHLAGFPADMYPIMTIAKKYCLAIIEDAAQSVLAQYDGKPVGSFGIAGCFSFHPLKVLNIWGDGGMITTNDAALAKKLLLWRNHGLRNRDEVEFFAHNSRLDTFHAAIADVLLPKIPAMIAKRKKNALQYNQFLTRLSPQVHLPDRTAIRVDIQPVYTNYIIQVERRDALLRYLHTHGVAAKVHYPIPIHLQKAAQYLGYHRGDFPVCERQAKRILTLPVHQYLRSSDIAYVCKTIERFYARP